MKIILVGALRYSNFGDILFAKLFYSRIRESHKDASVLLYETPINRVSAFCREELNYHEKAKSRDLKNADVLVYISGGYFANSFEKPLTKLLWHIRYARPGIMFSRKKKRIIVAGIGGGEFTWRFSANMVKRILNSAEYISARNIETASKFEQLGVLNEIHVNSDTAQVIANEKDRYCHKSNEETKELFLHIIPNDEYFSLMRDKVFPAVKRFIEERKHYIVVLGYDAKTKEKNLVYLEKAKSYFGGEKSRIHIFDSVEGFLNLLGGCDLIVTPKLHVGIVSASFDKSVLSFPINKEKTYRYYKGIGYPERCKGINEVEEEQVLAMLYQYCDERIILPSNVIREAEENLIACERI